MIVWDKGTYALAEGTDPAAEIAKGKIKFVMHGKKLRGLFTLVKIKPRPGESGSTRGCSSRTTTSSKIPNRRSKTTRSP